LVGSLGLSGIRFDVFTLIVLNEVLILIILFLILNLRSFFGFFLIDFLAILDCFLSLLTSFLKLFAFTTFPLQPGEFFSSFLINLLLALNCCELLLSDFILCLLLGPDVLLDLMEFVKSHGELLGLMHVLVGERGHHGLHVTLDVDDRGGLLPVFRFSLGECGLLL